MIPRHNEERIVPLSLLCAAAKFLGTDVYPTAWLTGGDEASILRVETKFGATVLHVSPAWRTRAELAWVHAVAYHTQRQIPQVVVPIRRGGYTMFEWQGRCVAVFPFVSGQVLDRDEPILRADAARRLAAIHNALLDFPGGTRPQSGLQRPVPPQDPDSIQDPMLDAWWSSVCAQGLRAGPTHGDYYRRNLLCVNDCVVGIIDWHDASIRPLALELAGSTFELCRNDEHVLQLDRAEEFIAVYQAARGPVPVHEVELLFSLMRVWIRDDVRSSLEHGAEITDGYVVKQIRAFHELTAQEWKPTGWQL